MTKLLYLENSQLLETQAKILQILQTDKGMAIILDQTIFYVQGGGQPGDKGKIINDTTIFEVTNTVKNQDGQILHIGEFTKDSNLKVGDEVVIKVDKAYRQPNTQNHSAGHLFDLAVKNLGLNWIPDKGFHFPEGSYVSYKIHTPTTLDLENLKISIQKEFDSLVSQNIPTKIEFDKSKLFHGQPLRTISFDGQSECPCGGTHVQFTGELKNYQISKLKLKSGNLKLSYKAKIF